MKREPAPRMLEYEYEALPPTDAVPAYLIFDGTFTMPGTVEDLWPFLLDYPSWQDFSSKQTIMGQPWELREVVLLKKEEPGLETFPSYYTRTLKVVPFRQLVWKTFPRRTGPGDQIFFGIIDFRLEPQTDSETRFRYNVYYEFIVSGMDEAAVQRYEEDVSSNFKQMTNSIFTKLMHLADKQQQERRKA